MAAGSRTSGKGRFVAVGHGGLRMTSPDGTTWSKPQTGKDGEVYKAVCFGGGRCVAAGRYGGDNLLTATGDGGATWTTGRKNAQYSMYILGLLYGRDEFMGLGGDPGSVGDARPFIVRSRDGVTWGDYDRIAGKEVLRRVAFGNGRFVGVGDRGRHAVSADGRGWKDAPHMRPVDTCIDVAFGQGVFVAVGLHGLRMTSVDGLAWTGRQVGEEGEHINTVLWTGAGFVAIGLGGTYLSPDGRQWTRRPNHNAPITAAFGNGVFVGARWKGRLLHSTDGLEWRQVLRAEQHVEAIAWG